MSEAVMQSQVSLPQASIEQVIERIFTTRRITRADQEQLMGLMLSKNILSESEKHQVSRVFDGLRAGLVRVID
jgi:hypothetical protein